MRKYIKSTTPSILDARPPKHADPRDLAEMQAAQQQARAKYRGEGICPCLDGAPPDVDPDFVLTDETWVSELEPWIPIRIINTLEKAGILRVPELRQWLAGGDRIEYLGEVETNRIRAALDAAERWGK